MLEKKVAFLAPMTMTCNFKKYVSLNKNHKELTQQNMINEGRREPDTNMKFHGPEKKTHNLSVNKQKNKQKIANQLMCFLKIISFLSRLNQDTSGKAAHYN